jgi:hypothetical protein
MHGKNTKRNPSLMATPSSDVLAQMRCEALSLIRTELESDSKTQEHEVQALLVQVFEEQHWPANTLKMWALEALATLDWQKQKEVLQDFRVALLETANPAKRPIACPSKYLTGMVRWKKTQMATAQRLQGVTFPPLFMKSARPAEFARSAEPVEFARSAEPVEFARPAEFVKPGRPVKPAKAMSRKPSQSDLSPWWRRD